MVCTKHISSQLTLGPAHNAPKFTTKRLLVFCTNSGPNSDNMRNKISFIHAHTFLQALNTNKCTTSGVVPNGQSKIELAGTETGP